MSEQQFPIVMRGYDRAQVDERVAQLESNLSQTRDHVSRLDTQILQLSADLSEAQASSQKISALLTPASVRALSASFVRRRNRHSTS